MHLNALAICWHSWVSHSGACQSVYITQCWPCLAHAAVWMPACLPEFSLTTLCADCSAGLCFCHALFLYHRQLLSANSTKTYVSLSRPPQCCLFQEAVNLNPLWFVSSQLLTAQAVCTTYPLSNSQSHDWYIPPVKLYIRMRLLLESQFC